MAADENKKEPDTYALRPPEDVVKLSAEPIEAVLARHTQDSGSEPVDISRALSDAARALEEALAPNTTNAPSRSRLEGMIASLLNRLSEVQERFGKGRSK